MSRSRIVWTQIPLLCVLLSACFLPARPRFPAEVATALRDQPMRRIETDLLVVYYPKKRRADALRVAERTEGCAAVIKSQVKIHNSYADQKMSIVIPDLPFNNAFVAPSALGGESVSVIPTSNTFDFTTELGIPADPSYVGCHEIVHYVQLLQVSGMWGWFNRYLGDTITPQIGMDFWFLEGLATYYESRLQPGTGRMAWPIWRGAFHAGFAEKRINGGDLSPFQRPFRWGNHYLVGSHFVEFLAKRYGEEAIWKVVEIQGGSILFPFGVALRWKSATGKSLPALIDEFADAVEKHFPVRHKPLEQETIRTAGTSARYAVAANGREAFIVVGTDSSTKIQIFDQGKRIRNRDLVEILPPRKLAIADPILTTGLSFTGDGKILYFVAIDQGPVNQEARLMRYTIDSDTLDVVVANLQGTGGGVTADGSTYYYAYSDGDRRHLAALDLATRKSQILRKAEARNYYELARPSPDGNRIVSALFNGQKFTVAVLDARSGRTEVEVPFNGAIHDPSWIDNNRLLLLAEFEGRFQVHIYDIDKGTLRRVSDAPYIAFQARAHGDSIRFLNRKGWHWTLDQIPLAPSKEAQPSPTLAAVASSGAPAHAIATANRKVRIHSDTAYSQLDSLFFPRFRAPLLLSAIEGASLLGLQLSGGDPLGFQRWSIFGQYDILGGNVSGGGHYVNAMLAPLDIRLELEHHKWNESITVDDQTEAGDLRSESHALVAVGRSIRTSRIDLVGIGLENKDENNVDVELRNRKLAGPGLLLQHQALRTTPYAGAHQGYVASASASHFNEALSSLDVDLTDVGGSLDLVTPLPFSPRHTLFLGLRGRRLYGPDRDNSFLVVGGDTLRSELWSRSNKEEPGSLVLPRSEPLLTFQEPLRGFENLEFSSDRIAIADLTYRLPVILDVGVSSLAYLLPGLFFRQFTLEIFGAAATDSFANFGEHNHLAAGASLALDMAFSLVPLSLRYQLAQRFTDDEAMVHLLTLGAGL